MLGDCVSVIDMMMEGDKTSAPMHFSHDPNQGFQVPHRWVNQTCLVQIDLVDKNEDTMKLSEIAFTAVTIMELCVDQPGHPNLGGSGTAGRSRSMKVVVAGTTRIPNLIDPDLNSTLQLG